MKRRGYRLGGCGLQTEQWWGWLDRDSDRCPENREGHSSVAAHRSTESRAGLICTKLHQAFIQQYLGKEARFFLFQEKSRSVTFDALCG